MTKSRQWVVGTAVLALLVLVAGWFLLVSPKRSKAAELKTDTASQQSANESLQMQIKQLRARAADLPKEQALLAQIAAKLPSDPALPTLIRDLSKAADDADVTLVSLAPGQPQLMAATPVAQPASTATQSSASSQPSASGQPAANGAAAAGRLAMIPLSINVTGGFFQLEQFFSNLENLTRSLMTTDVAIGAAAGGGSASASGSDVKQGDLTVTLTSRVFMTVQQQQAPAAPKPQAPAPSGTK